jgi:hypothetical protein
MHDTPVAMQVMAAELGRLEEARSWFEEGTSSAEGAASVALWQVMHEKSLLLCTCSLLYSFTAAN